MQYRLDTKNGKELSALGFGCMRFPTRVGGAGGIDLDAAEKLVLSAVEKGINYFDTAYAYSGNEIALGEVLMRNPKLREKINIATKIPITRCERREDLDKYLDRSLDRLGLDSVDYYLIHNVTSARTWEKLERLGFVDWVDSQKAAGRIGQIGFSYHGPEGDFPELLDVYDWDFCQIQYNYMNEHYQAGTAGLNAAAKREIPVIVMEPLLGGKLTAPLPKEAKRVLSENRIEDDPVSLALRWIWDHPAVTVVLSGMNTLEQVAQNVEIANDALPGCLSEPEAKAIEYARESIADNFKIPCTGCSYCMPCPHGVNIPVCFNAYNNSYAFGWFEGLSWYITACGVMTGDPHYASDCTQCSACLEKCPQHIAIPDELKLVKRRLQPPGLPVLAKFGARFITR